MGIPKTFLLGFLGIGLCLTGSQALQCYSFEHTYFGPFDLSAMTFPSVSCPQGCSEAMLLLDTGYRSLVTIVRKGCWTGPTTGPMQSNQDALPPDYAVVRGCATDFCNSQLKNHDSLPNLSQVMAVGSGHCQPGAMVSSIYCVLQAPDPPTLSGTECYACLGTSPEDCSPERSRRVQCHQDQSVCFQGNGQMNIGNFSVPVYIRTCHRPSCTTMGTTSPWTSIDLQGYCCEGHLCNRNSVTQTLPGVTSPAPPRAPGILTLLLVAPLLAIALGGSPGLTA